MVKSLGFIFLTFLVLSVGQAEESFDATPFCVFERTDLIKQSECVEVASSGDFQLEAIMACGWYFIQIESNKDNYISCFKEIVNKRYLDSKLNDCLNVGVARSFADFKSCLEKAQIKKTPQPPPEKPKKVVPPPEKPSKKVELDDPQSTCEYPQGQSAKKISRELYESLKEYSNKLEQEAQAKIIEYEELLKNNKDTTEVIKDLEEQIEQIEMANEQLRVLLSRAIEAM